MLEVLNTLLDIYINMDSVQNKIESLEATIKKYEEDGVAKLYYALRRKAWEMADMLNSVNLKTIPIDDGKDKSFERIRYIINDSAGIAAAVKALGEAAGVTGDEKKDVEKKSFNERLAMERS